MRDLTKNQTKILDKFIESQLNKTGFSDAPFTQNRYSLDADDLPAETFAVLEQINDTEILYQNVQRYLSDKSFEVKYR